jgi:hypothetical protein
VKQEKLQKINTFHIQQLAYILEQMQSIREDEGTLLDNRVLVYGAGISDGDRHDDFLGRPADSADARLLAAEQDEETEDSAHDEEDPALADFCH